MSAAKRTYVVYESCLTTGWDVVCMNGPDPLYVIDHCATEGEARALAHYVQQGQPLVMDSATGREVKCVSGATAPKCLYRNPPEKDCGARACPIHGTPSASPYGRRRGTVITPATDEQIERSFDAYR